MGRKSEKLEEQLSVSCRDVWSIVVRLDTVYTKYFRKYVIAIIHVKINREYCIAISFLSHDRTRKIGTIYKYYLTVYVNFKRYQTCSLTNPLPLPSLHPDIPVPMNLKTTRQSWQWGPKGEEISMSGKEWKMTINNNVWMVNLVLPYCSSTLINRFGQLLMMNKGKESYLRVDPNTVENMLQSQWLHNLCMLIVKQKIRFQFS